MHTWWFRESVVAWIPLGKVNENEKGREVRGVEGKEEYVQAPMDMDVDVDGESVSE